jgi:hypothetical protein
VRGPTRAERQAVLAQLETRLAAAPDDDEAALDRARLLTELGRDDDARSAYLALVARCPDHFRVLNDFGTFLLKSGFREAARTAYSRAVELHPREAIGHANLANVHFALGDFEAARARYQKALRLDPDLVEAHQGLSFALTRLGREEEAQRHRERGFRRWPVTTALYRGTGGAVDVLVLTAARGGTFYTDAILDDRIFRTSTLTAEYYDPGAPLPPHRLIVNAISDADRCRTELTAMAQAFAGAAVPIVNDPRRVLLTGRRENAERFGRLDGVITPGIAQLRRSALLGPDADAVIAEAGFGFPLLVRAPGFHTGEHFALVDRPAALPEAVAALPGDELLVLEYVDVRDPDGKVRKYRVMAIDGVLYPLHLATSNDWKVHYLTADMAGNAAHRAADSRFLDDLPSVLGPAATAALERVRDAIGLDYFGIDFGLDAAGRVVVFEANATMIVVPPGPDERWAYRRPHVERILAATRAMLLARAS